MTNKQKFQRYDLVHIAKDLGRGMHYFNSDVDAIVLYSYNQEYDNKPDGEKQYSLYVKGYGQTAWYYEEQLTLILPNQKEKLHEFQDEVHKKQAELYDKYLSGELKRILL